MSTRATVVSLVLVAASLSLGIVITAPNGETQTDPTTEQKVEVLWADFCERKPNHQNCLVPTPTPTPSPEPTPTPSECDATVVAPASIQAAIDANPEGSTLCLEGSFTPSAPIDPKDGNTFLGPAVLNGQDTVDTGFQIKDGVGADTGAQGVTIDDLELHSYSLRGIDCWLGTTVRNSRIHDNGRNGLGCGTQGGGGILIEDNHIYANGDPSQTGGGASGMKFANTNGLVIRGNLIEGNTGNGIWCDLDCGAFTATGNTVLGSTRKGIFFEISKGPATITGNTVQKNNCHPDYWNDGNPECDLPDGSFGPQSAGSPGGGIAMNSSCPASSAQCVIRVNVLGSNMVAGINFRDDARQYNAPFNILVEDNLLNGDALRNCNFGIVCRNNVP